MKKLFALIILTINLIEQTQANPYLFEFEKDGKKSRIFGSNHYVSLSKLPQTIQSILFNHKILVGEIAETPVRMLTRENLRKLLRTKKTPNYFKALSSDQKKRVLTFAKLIPFYKKHVKIDQLTPLGIFTLYHSGCCAHGIDCKMNDFFSTKGSVIGLEEVNFRPVHMSFQSLKNSIDTPSGSAFIDRMYLQGNVEKFSTSSSLEESIVRIRNENWFPQIVKINQAYGDDVIFVVGVSHLLGKHGILNMLHEQKFTIKRANKKGRFFPYHTPTVQRKLFQKLTK